MRATLLYGAGDIRVETVPDARLIEPTDALVCVSRACICGSDLWPYNEMEPAESGRPMGHEALGVVEEGGADVRTVKAGDLVIVPFAFSDGTCEFCNEGLHTSCVKGGFFGSGEMLGAQAEATGRSSSCPVAPPMPSWRSCSLTCSTAGSSPAASSTGPAAWRRCPRAIAR